MSKEGPKQWCALYVAARCEKVVAAQLKVLDIETIVPIQKEIRQWSDRKKVVETVLFPNYVFLAPNIYQYEAVNKLDHVVGFVRFGGRIAVLSEREVALITQIAKVEHPVVIHSGAIAPGDEVEIISGPLKNQRGRIQLLNGTTKVQIAIPSLGSFAQIIVRKEDLKKVTPQI